MPNKIKKILLIGPGPVIIGRGGELDLAAIQACQALKKMGYQIVVVDSNPAAVLGDQGIAERVYYEPLTIESLTKLIKIEKPDAILPIFGGQNALNLTYFLNEKGLLKENKIQIIGANLKVIEKTEDLRFFYETLTQSGVDLPKYSIVRSLREGEGFSVTLGFPLAVKAAMAPEGAGVTTVYNQDELKEGLELALELSPIHQVLLVEGLNGWKEIELEMLRDSNGDCRLIAFLENIDPVGVHTGDSMMVVPAQSFSDSDYQRIINLGKTVMEALEIIGGANIQIAVNPSNGQSVILEVNPRFTRSTALASLATGLSAAVLAVRIALGEFLINLWPNVESVPTQILFKVPCFDFEKFPTADPILTSNMKSTGAVVGVGSNFKEAFQKALRSLGATINDIEESSIGSRNLREKVMNARSERLNFIRYALKTTNPVDLVEQSKLSLWFINELVELNVFERELNTYALYNLPRETLLQAKQWGYSDQQLAKFFRTTSDEIREKRLLLKMIPNFKPSSEGGYLYSTYQGNGTTSGSETEKIMLIGGGANRIGQGSEFDYNLFHAAAALKQSGYPSILINSNPFSVTLDLNSSVKFYFEPVTTEDLLNIIDYEGSSSVICQMGGPVTTELSLELFQSGVKVLGTNPRLKEIIDHTQQFEQMLNKLSIEVPKSGVITDSETAEEIAYSIGYPLVIRERSVPSKLPAVICQQAEDMKDYFKKVKTSNPGYSFLVSKLIESGIGVGVDCIVDGKDTVICGIMEQIEEAGIHPGDSAVSLPPYTLGKEILSRIRQITIQLAKELGIKGMINLHCAIQHDRIYLIGLDLGVSRTVPFVSKITGVDWAGTAAKIMAGVSLAEQNLVMEVTPKYTGIKEAVLPFDRFSGVDATLGPEMRSTGTVMGVSSGFGLAFIKSQLASGGVIPITGTIFISIRNQERRAFVPIAKQLTDLGYQLVAAAENSEYLVKNGVACNSVFQVGEGRPNILDQIKNANIQWVISTTSERVTKGDEGLIRSTAVAKGVPIITTLAAAQAAVAGLETYLKEGLNVESLY